MAESQASALMQSLAAEDTYSRRQSARQPGYNPNDPWDSPSLHHPWEGKRVRYMDREWSMTGRHFVVLSVDRGQAEIRGLEHSTGSIRVHTSMLELAAEQPECPSSHSGQHTWICISSLHGPAATYGCQFCPAETTGADIGVTRQQ